MYRLGTFFRRKVLRSVALVNLQPAKQQIYTSRNLYETFSRLLPPVGPNNSDLNGISESNKTSDWLQISASFDSSGKRQILPLCSLMKLTSLVKEKKDFFTSQVLKEDSKMASGSLSGAEPNSIDEGTPDAEEPEAEKTKKKELKDKKSASEKRTKENSTSESKDDVDVTVKRKIPNYFVAVQITSPEIQVVAKKIQDGIQKTTKVNLRRVIIGAEKFHITLMVMHLPNKEEVKKAAESLDNCVPHILERTCGQSVVLDFEGLSTFNGGRVLFATVKPTEGLEYLSFMADEVAAQMKNNGIVTTDKASKKFNPHLTLLKFDGDRELRRQGVTKVQAGQYEPYIHEVFGAQTISSLQLCQMERKRPDGYYFVEHEVFFNK